MDDGNDFLMPDLSTTESGYFFIIAELEILPKSTTNGICASHGNKYAIVAATLSLNGTSWEPTNVEYQGTWSIIRACLAWPLSVDDGLQLQ